MLIAALDIAMQFLSRTLPIKMILGVSLSESAPTLLVRLLLGIIIFGSFATSID
jgi:hypothetical protein